MAFSPDENGVLETAASWLQAGHKVALGTVIRTSGSAPRQAGSHIAVRDDGAFAGSVSAGCVEGAVVEQALAVMDDSEPRWLKFGVADDGTFTLGLMCGGDVEILIEPIS